MGVKQSSFHSNLLLTKDDSINEVGEEWDSR